MRIEGLKQTKGQQNLFLVSRLTQVLVSNGAIYGAIDMPSFLDLVEHRLNQVISDSHKVIQRIERYDCLVRFYLSQFLDIYHRLLGQLPPYPLGF